MGKRWDSGKGGRWSKVVEGGCMATTKPAAKAAAKRGSASKRAAIVTGGASR
jgi:hypothetical protein